MNLNWPEWLSHLLETIAAAGILGLVAWARAQDRRMSTLWQDLYGPAGANGLRGDILVSRQRIHHIRGWIQTLDWRTRIVEREVKLPPSPSLDSQFPDEKA